MKHFLRFFLLPTELPEKYPNLTAQKKDGHHGHPSFAYHFINYFLASIALSALSTSAYLSFIDNL